MHDIMNTATLLKANQRCVRIPLFGGPGHIINTDTGRGRSELILVNVGDAGAIRQPHRPILSVGQMKGEGASFAGDAFDRDISAVDLGDVLDDGQTQAGPAELAAAAFVHHVESFKDPRKMLGRNAAA